MRRQISLRTTAALCLVCGVVNKNEIEIGIVVQLSPAELTTADHGEPSSRHRSIFLFQLFGREFKSTFEARVGKVGKLNENLQQVDAAAEIVETDPHEFFGPMTPQGIKLGFDVVMRRDGNAQLGEHFIFGFFDPRKVDAD